MAKIYYEKNEPYSVAQLFNLVNDVDSYPQFVPDCRAAGVLTRSDSELTAFIEIEKLGFKKRFSTCNRLYFPTHIDLSLIKGPFKRLKGQWRFLEQSASTCKIALELEFEFNNGLLELAFSSVFKEIMKNMVNAFSQRAKRVYG